MAHRTGGQLEVSICISTFRRPDGLSRLLQSLQRLDHQTPHFEVIVVDNDLHKSAYAVVQTARASGFVIQYLVEPEQNIAKARNLSVSVARGTYVAFIDDDEEADPLWLWNLWREASSRGLDGAVGPIVPCFSASAPKWLQEGGFYDRPRFPTGTVLSWYQTRTGNALVRRSRLMARSGPFNESFGLIGGEDCELFARMIEQGSTFCAVDSARVYETVQEGRARPLWLLKRHFLTGISIARFKFLKPGQPDRFRYATSCLCLATWFAIRGIFLLPLSRIGGLRCLLRSSRQLGAAAFLAGVEYAPYLYGEGR